MFFLVLSGSAPAAAPEVPAWTNARVRSTTPEQVTRSLFGELSSALLPDFQAKDDWRFYGRLMSLRFYSVPRAGLNTGLCEVDWIHVTFAPIDKGGDPHKDLPVRPSKIESMQIHFIRDLAHAVRGGTRTAAQQASFDENCAARDPRRETRITAFNPDDIVIALRLLTELTEAARRGKALAPLDCTGLAREKGPLSKSECLAEVAAIRPGEIDNAPRPETVETGVVRWVETPTWRLRFEFAAGQTVPTSEFFFRNGRAVPLRVVVERVPDLSPMIIHD